MNQPPSPRSEETIFASALALPAAARSTYLDQACAGDAGLRGAVEALLRAHEGAAGFLPSVLPAAGETVVRATHAGEQPGDWIGRYRLLQRIGEGGCGVVYMAEQEEPVRRRVALKVIKPGMDTKAVVARFEAERQALAMMDHSNIARVFDAGTTESGRPFFVMELVRGVPITRYCDEGNLPTERRLELFNLVCHAVQHAHQKGIIHRDLKPSNILVTLHDGVPVPKVIDFGIAKATQGRLTEQTLFTAFEQFMGTPAYMSPEQAEMSGLDIDTRSDIYSLGVLLYELLAGRPPFEAKTLMAAGLDEMRRMIREVDPPRPSNRLGTLSDADLSTVARLRGTAPARLTTMLSGDLDWIVMRCLEKDRMRRYGTPTELAADINRHLRNEPVTARPPSTVYLLQKLVRRHRMAVAAAAAVTLALLAGLVAATWQAVRATRAEQAARKEARTSERVAEALASVFSEIGTDMYRGEDTKLLKALLDESARRLPARLKDEPAVLAWVSGAFAQTYYFTLMEPVEGKKLAQQRLVLLRGLNPVPPEDEIDALATLAAYQIGTDNLDEGEALLKEAMAKAGRLEGNREEMTEMLLDVQAQLLDSRREFERARQVLQEILDRKRKRLGPHHLEVAGTLMDLASIEFRFDRNSTRREALIREAFEIRRQHLPDGDGEVAEAAVALAGLYAVRGAYRQAEALLRQQLAAMPRPLPPGLGRVWLSLSGQLAELGVRRKDFDLAVGLLRERLAYARANFPPDHDLIGAGLARLSAALRQRGDLTEAESLARESQDLWGRRHGTDSAQYHAASVQLARVLMKRQEYAAADALINRAIEHATRAHGAGDLRVAPYLTELARQRLAQGDPAGAVALYRRVQAMGDGADNTQPNTPGKRELAAALTKAGEHGEAETLLLEA